MRPTRRRHLALLTAAATGAATLAAGSAVAQASPSTVSIPSTLPAWVAHAAPAASPLLAGQAMTARVYLTPRGGLAALEARTHQLSDPASAGYRHWLTSAQYAATYAPSAAQVASVTAYLKGAGVTVTGVEAHNRYVSVSASTSTLATALGTNLASFVHNGRSVTAPTKAVSLPTAVGANVLTVTGLDTTQVVMKHGGTSSPDSVPPGGFINARPCNLDYGTIKAKTQADFSTPLPKFNGQYLPYAPCGYTGPSLRAAYEGRTSLTGKGVTIAIIDAYAWQNAARDANTYAVANGDGSYAPGQYSESVPVDGYRAQGLCGPSGWAGEEMLDIESSHAMAPLAKIKYYAARSCLNTDLDDTLARFTDDNTATIVSNSYGSPEEALSGAEAVVFHSIALQASTQGQSILVSSGDNGDELDNTTIKQADFPASSPDVTAVGGTSTGIAFGQKLFDAGWGTQRYALTPDGKSWASTGFLYGSGGGYSFVYNRPTYQNGVVPVKAPAGRAVPDVAMDGDPNTGFRMGITQKFLDGSVHYGEFRIGGTSLSSPLFAGMTALAVENAGGIGLGRLNDAIYSAPKATFSDVKPGVGDPGVVRADYPADPATGITNPNGPISYTVRTFGQDSSLPVTTGWDPVTGVGVPTPAYFSSFPAPAANS